MRIALVVLMLLAAAPVAAQDTPVAADNPLASLKADLVRVLAEADLPFEAEQDRELTLMMEDRLQASEDRKSTRLNSSHSRASRMPSSA